jgi:ABC-2 type transport system ATP-binding protein
VSAIRVEELRKRYGEEEALRGISFEIEEGEVFGLLGPNGAGKTTTVEILEGYRPRDGGRVEVLGFDPQRSERSFRERIGGQKRRLDLGIALVGDPQLVFLDEPTTGFDPAARRTAWEMIRSLRSLGKTVLLTTHYLDEAQQLSDRVAVLRQGRIVTIGAPSVLTGGSVEAEIRYRRNGEQVVQRTTEPTRVLHELTAAALARGEELEGLEVRRPSLEDVYLSLVEEPEAETGAES